MSEHTTPSSQTNIKLGFLTLCKAYIKFALTILSMELTAGVALIGLFFLKPFPRWSRKFRRYMFRITTGSMLLCMNVQIKTKGKPPKKPYFMVGNHLGYVDTLLMASLTGATFVAKAEVRKWPGVGPVSALYNTIYIDRENRGDVHRVSRLVEENISNGEGVIIFPEGTSTDGQGVNPFYSSLFDFPAKHNFPVHTFSIHYDTGSKKLPASHAVCWWGDIDFMPHMKLMLATRRVKATVVFHEVVLAADNRKMLAEAARDAVIAHFKPCDTFDR